MQNEIHDLHRRIDNAQAVRVLLHCGRKELLVQLHQYALPRFGIVQAARPESYAFVEALQVPRFVFKSEFPKIRPQRVQGLRHRIGLRKIVLLEERLENRPGQDVLRHHFNSPLPVDGVVEPRLQFLVKPFEPFAQGLVFVAIEQVLDPPDEAQKDVCNIPGPGFPVLAIPAFLDDFRENGAGG